MPRSHAHASINARRGGACSRTVAGFLPHTLASVSLVLAYAMGGIQDSHAAAPASSKAGAASSAPSASRLPAGVTLRVNGKDIPHERFIAELDESLGESYRETFIAHVLIDEKAQALGVEASSDEIEARVQDTIAQVQKHQFSDDVASMEAALKERGMTLEGWKRRLRVDSRYDVLVEKLLEKERTVSEEDIQRIFEDRYGPSGVMIKVRHILKNVPVASSQDYTLQQYEQEKAKVDDEARVRAEEALGKLRGKESFESVMATYSDDPRRHSGGILTSWKGRFGPDMDAAASKLGKGETSGVIKSTDGYRIVQCTDITDNEEVHAQHILVATGPKGGGRTDEEARKRAEQLLARIKAGEDFGQIARESSDDPGSATRGGDLGFFGARAMVKPFEDAAFALSPGQLSDVVKTNFGYHIIKLLEKRKSQDRTLRQIFVGTQFVVVKDRKLRPRLEEKARKELDALLVEIRKPEGSFAEAAKIGSEDVATKGEGGLLRNYRQGLYGAEFDEAVNALKPGDPPRIVKDAAGNLHLVYVEDIVKTDLESVRGDIVRQEIKRPASPQEKSDYVGGLRRAATVEP